MHNIFWFYGNNAYAIQAKIHSWQKAFQAKNPDTADMQFFKASEIPKIPEFLQILKTPSLLSPKRLIIIQDLVLSKKYHKDLLASFSDICTDNILILQDPKLPRLPKQLPSNLKLQEFKLNPQALKQIIVDITAKSQKQFAANLIQYLITSFQTRPLLLAQETHKALNCSPQKTIQLQDYQKIAHLNLENSAFQILDLYAKNQNQKSIQAIHQVVKQQGDIFGLWHLIIWQFTVLHKIQNQLITQEKPFVIQKNTSLAQRLSPRKVQLSLKKLCQIDQQIKFGQIQKPKEIAQALIQALYA